MEALGKPSGITLDDHTRHVVEHARAVLAARPFMAKKYLTLTGDAALDEQVIRVAAAHDLGKKHRIWQSACQEDYKAYRQWRERQGLDPAAVVPEDYERYSDEQKATAGAHLRKGELRHEFASLPRFLNVTKQQGAMPPTLAERAAIAAHHRKLGWQHKERWYAQAKGAFGGEWEALEADAKMFFKAGRKRTQLTVLKRYKVAAVRALLQLADTRASREEAGKQVPPITPFSYDFPHTKQDGSLSLRPVQEAARKHAHLTEMILRAPTGSGKTDAALLWAKQQIEVLQRADRLIMAMPTRFTSNALAINVAGSLSDTGLYHSSAWVNWYQPDNSAGKEKRDDAKEQQKLARLLVTPITVCTIDHLLIALTGAREDHHAIFFNLANACVVFDETDFYDPFIQANLVVLLRVLRWLKVPFLMMSATVPESARALYEIQHPIVEPQPDQATLSIDERSTPERVLHFAGPSTGPEDIAGVLERFVEARRGIIYANTIERAMAYYRWFEERGIETILYHSLFTEPDKKRIEQKLIAALGRKAWWAGTASCIAILTQIGEMSINISAPLMLSDMCPVDRLAQRAGRLLRFGFGGPSQGILYLTTPQKKGALYPAPYGEWTGKQWKPARALAETMRLAQEGPFTPASLLELVNTIYADVLVFEDKSLDNQKRLYDAIKANWLIVPEAPAKKDDDVYQAWRSRDIGPTETIFIETPEHFYSYDAYRSFEAEYGISCPAYLIENELRRSEREGLDSRITLLNRKLQEDHLQMAYTSFYDAETGLGFLREPIPLENEWDDEAPTSEDSPTIV
ncbi:MAG: hypothetical protein RhofKO_01180 [Rhodothermales bacterium]